MLPCLGFSAYTVVSFAHSLPELPLLFLAASYAVCVSASEPRVCQAVCTCLTGPVPHGPPAFCGLHHEVLGPSSDPFYPSGVAKAHQARVIPHLTSVHSLVSRLQFEWFLLLDFQETSVKFVWGWGLCSLHSYLRQAGL